MKAWIKTILFIGMYILVANGRTVHFNPYIPDQVIAFNVIFIVIAGITSGKYVGLSTGFFATVLNVLTPAGSAVELVNIIPFTIMGYVAGILKDKVPLAISALTISIGYVFGELLYLLFGFQTMDVFLTTDYFLGIGVEILLGWMSIIIVTTIIRLANDK